MGDSVYAQRPLQKVGLLNEHAPDVRDLIEPQFKREKMTAYCSSAKCNEDYKILQEQLTGKKTKNRQIKQIEKPNMNYPHAHCYDCKSIVQWRLPKN